MRERQRAPRAASIRYDGTWRDRDPSDAPPGVPPVIRLKAPREGETVIRRSRPGPRHGRQRSSSTISSSCAPTARRPTISRSSSTITTWRSPMSSAATTISPTPSARPRSIARSAGTVPEFAHVPLIHGPDGAKLSKRHGALGVDAYRDMGYLPEALRNYLLRLGWSHGDDEIISTDAGDPMVRPRRGRPRAGALRFRQARQSQRPLHPRGRRRAARRADRAAARARARPRARRRRRGAAASARCRA